MSSVSSFDSNLDTEKTESSSGLGLNMLNDVKVKLEPVDSPPENQMESLNSLPQAVSPLLPLGVHHRMRVYSRSTQSTSPETFACEVCQGEFMYQEVLQTHKLLHFNTSHVCYACDCYFLKTETLVGHMSTIHGNMSVVSQSHKGEIFVCNICLQRFSSKKILQKHENLHVTRDEANHSCKVCALEFVGYRALLAHLTSSRHREMKVKMQNIFVCVDCRSIFASRDSYAMHMMVRAQNESCDTKPGQLPVMPSADQIVKSEAASPVPDPPEINGHGTHEELTSPLNLSKESSKSDAVLARGISAALASISHRHQYHCTRCQKAFPTQDALAMHVMLHAKTEAEDEHQQSIQSKLGAALLDRQAALLRAALPFSSLAAVPAAAAAANPLSNAALSLLSRHAISMWPCGICQMSFQSCDLLAMHVMDKHTGNTKTYNGVNSNGTSRSSDNGDSREATLNPERISHLNSVVEELQKKIAKAARSPEESEEPKTALKRRLSLPDMNCIAEDDEEEVPEKRCRSADHINLARNSAWWKIMKLRFDSGHACVICQKTFADHQELAQHLEHPDHERQVLATKENTHSPPAITTNGDSGRNSRRKIRHVNKITQGFSQSPEPSEMSPWMNDRTSAVSTPSGQPAASALMSPVSACDEPPTNGERCPSVASSASRSGAPSQSSPKPPIGIPEGVRDADLLEYILGHVDSLVMCKFCGIIFTDRTMYYLHMGLHNVNNPWQCNLCGKVCANVHQFSSHVIHY